MSGASDQFTFFQVSSNIAAEAFAFHQSVSSTNEHIWPRTEEEIKAYSESGELFGVRQSQTGQFVGLCYSTLDEKTNEWEVGGLTVAEKFQKFHLGSALVRFALAHTIAYYRPWKYGQRIIAHVHAENQKPRRLLERIGFEFVEKVVVPGDLAPSSMKRNEEGKLCGDKFEYPQKAIPELSEWFEREPQTLADGTSQAIFEIRPAGPNGLRESLREAVAELKKAI